MATKARAVRYDEIDGKTVAGAGYGFDRMLIAFTDGTVLAIESQDCCDGSELNFLQATDVDLLSRQWSSEANEAGLISREQWLEANKKHEAERIKRLEKELANLRGSKTQ